MKPRSVKEHEAAAGIGRYLKPRSGNPENRALCVIPAHNEAANLPTVVHELRAECPTLDVLVVDDGSTDGTAAVAAELDVRLLRLPERLGIGNAMRAGLRYAARLGYDIVVRVDGDGQHRAGEINQLIAPIAAGRADAVMGTRFAESRAAERGAVRVAQRVLAACISTLTGACVTDPTSGFSAFGQRAIYLLAEHHPTGYPEPELLLLLNRNGLVVVEIPVHERSRLAGRTSLTPVRLVSALGRVLLAMVIVPLRRIDQAVAGD
jgi:glycosyltransferase involved in cell wall biosynthesis